MYIIILFIVAAITRLAHFGHPSEVVFDEVYNGGFVGNYTTENFYFDIHPPLGKILVKWWSDLVGGPAGLDWSSIGNSLPDEAVLLRFLPIFVGILLPIVIYLICRHLNLSKGASFVAGLLVVFENSLIVQSRFILFDIFLLFFGFLSVLYYMKFVQNRERWLFLLSSIIFAGAAFSIKWTGLAFPLLILILECIEARKMGNKLSQFIKIAGAYAVGGLIIYLMVFAVHFHYLKRSGPGDAFMSDRFQKTLSGSPYENSDILVPKGFFGKTIELNFKMYEANFNLSSDHPYASPWYSWPIMKRSIFYWETKVDESYAPHSYIYLIGNPFVYWVGLLSLVGVAWHYLRKKDRGVAATFILIGFLVNFAPFVFIGRSMFLYHYEAALIFCILALAYSIDQIQKEKEKKIVFCAVVGVSLALFWFFSPLTYGTPLNDQELKARMWLSTWR